MATKSDISGNLIITVENSYGHRISVGDKVKHTDQHIRGSARVLELIWKEDRNEVEAYTSKGFSHIDYLRPIKEIAIKTMN